jgi:hypothetical protein
MKNIPNTTGKKTRDMARLITAGQWNHLAIASCTEKVSRSSQ